MNFLHASEKQTGRFGLLFPDAGANGLFESFCPYRVCPMGAHIDHQHGKVLGMAIDRGVSILFSPSDDKTVTVASMNFEGIKSFSLSDVPDKQNDWADYIRGAALALLRHHGLQHGIYALIEGTLPIGGLSSSAAVIISFLNALCRANSITLSPSDMIKTALWSENNYVGISVGKLDQSCEILSKKNHLLYLDTLDDSYELILQNAKMKPYDITIFFSGVQRTLVGSKFNTRVGELRSAANTLKALAGIEYGDVTEAYMRDVERGIYDKYGYQLPEEWRKRAEHFYTESARVEKGAKLWREGDLEGFGRLIFESGHSSIYNYETGSDELIALYNIMLRTKGIYGGRFSGAGFKGCCMALSDPDEREQIKKTVTGEYLRIFPHLQNSFSVCFCHSADGVQF